MTADPLRTSRRAFVQLLGTGGAAMALSGCETGLEELVRDLQEPDGGFAPPDGADIDLTTHALNRMTWGPAPGEYERVRAMGFDAFLDEQLAPDRLRDRRAQWKVASIESLTQPTGELYEYHPRQLLFQSRRLM